MKEKALMIGDFVKFKSDYKIPNVEMQKVIDEAPGGVFKIDNINLNGEAVTFEVPWDSYLYEKWIYFTTLERVNKFRVGDEVSIKEWYEMEKEYGVTTTPTGQYSINIVPYFTVQMKNSISLKPFKIKELEHHMRDGKSKFFITPELSGINLKEYGFGLFTLTEEMVKSSKVNKLSKDSIINESHITTYTHDNEIVVTIEKDEYMATGAARCCPEDKFDFITGFKIALERAEEKLAESMNNLTWVKGTRVRIKGAEYSEPYRNIVCRSEYAGKYATLLKDYDLSKVVTIEDVRFDIEYMEAINKHNGRVKFSLNDIEKL